MRKKKEIIQKNFMKTGVKMFLRAGMMPARTFCSPCSGDVSHRQVKIEKTDDPFRQGANKKKRG